MSWPPAILTAGVEAVNVYKEVSNSGQDNEVPEGLFLAAQANKHLRLFVS
jgi:hypothetical protein